MPDFQAKSAPRATDEFVIRRRFNAPRGPAWRARTGPQRLMRRSRPNMLPTKVDFSAGGVSCYRTRKAERRQIWGGFAYREIVEPERLVFAVSFVDEQGNAACAPFNKGSPKETLSLVTFTEHGGQTALAVRWSPLTRWKRSYVLRRVPRVQTTGLEKNARSARRLLART